MTASIALLDSDHLCDLDTLACDGRDIRRRRKQRIPIDPLFHEGNITRSPAWHSLQGRSKT